MIIRISPPLKWHGGKSYLARRIVALIRPHVHYVEPFAGGLAVLLAKNPEGVSEVVNDLDGRLCNFWRVLQDEKAFGRFRRQVEAVPFSREMWQEAAAYDPADDPFAQLDTDPVNAAVAFFVACRQSLAGRRDSFAPLSRTRTRRGMNEQASAWLTAVEGLPAVHDRLKRVVVENRDALDLIRAEDGPGTLYYCDPPYLQSTRTASDTYGPFEMTEEDHRRLLDTLGSIKGRFLLSGYQSDLYDTFAERHSWQRVDFDLPNNAAGGKSKRRMVECVWMNYRAGEGRS